MREWLAKKRSEKGLKQEEVANLAGIARTTYAMIEQDNRDPSVHVAKRIAKVLDFDWTLFFEGDCHEMRSKSRHKTTA